MLGESVVAAALRSRYSFPILDSMSAFPFFHVGEAP